MPDTNLAGLRATERGLLKAFPENDSPDAIIPIIEKGTAENVARAMARTMRLSNPPTAILATRSRHALSLISWMAQQNLNIPRDLSLVTLASEPWYEHLIPRLSHYFSDPENFARTVLRHILPIAAGKTSSATNKLLIPEYISGQTVAMTSPAQG